MQQLFRFNGDRRRSTTRDIQKLLVSWDGVLCDLEDAMAPWGLPYAYGERPSLGILAAAAARIGFVPFEEYSADKGRGKSRRSGRADLWLATKSGERAYDFEAKYIPRSFNSKRLVTTLERHLDIAAKDASSLTYKSDCTIGIVFVSPYGATHKGFDPDPFWDQLSDFTQYGGDVCAFHICRPEIWGSNLYWRDRPGIAIVGRYV